MTNVQQFKYLLKRFVNQANQNILKNAQRKASLGEEGFERYQFSRKSGYDILFIDNTEYHIHLFSTGSYGPTSGNGSTKIPYFDIYAGNGLYANVRTHFRDYKLEALTIVLWERRTNQDISEHGTYELEALDLYSDAAPNETLTALYDTFMNLRQGDNTMIDDYVQKLEHSKNIILRGAPGTGKSYLAKEIAAQLIGIHKNELQESGQFEFVQFHPSYDYTDFVEGLRPEVASGDQMKFTLKNGVFKEFCERAKSKTINGEGKTIKEIWNEFIESIADEEIEIANYRFRANSRGNITYTVPGGTTASLTLDHVIYYLEHGKWNNNNDHSTYKKPIFEKYIAPKLTGQVQDNHQPYVFVIDEINRGEISKILGELFFAIDPSYRGTAGAVATQYHNLHPNAEKFYVPENVYIIGTMNDIDRSVDSFDFAMRRRFRFIEVKAEDTIGMWHGELAPEREEEARRRLNALNGQISAIDELNANYHIGPSYFLRLPELDYNYNVLWADYLQPLLEEYIRGSYNEQEKLEQLKRAYMLEDEVDAYTR